MIPKRKMQIILVLMLTSVFLFQNCATIISGKSQIIPVTSNPAGAKIIVDGEERGYAPLNLKLKRKKSHIIRIEKQGCNPIEIRITRKSSSLLAISILGNTIWGFAGGFLGALAGWGLEVLLTEEYYDDGPYTGLLVGMIAGALSGWGGAIYVDSKSGAIYSLSPKELNVTLKKIEGRPQPYFILIDSEHFQNIKWIRIECADSDGEEIVNLD